MPKAVKDVRIDASQIPDNVRRQLGAALLKAYRDHASGRKETPEEKKREVPTNV